MAPYLESLFGVSHGGEGITFDGYKKEILVEPSEALKQGLKELTPGSRVGIEYHPHLALPFSLYGQTLTFSPSTIYYWTRVDELCRGLGHDVVYLEDIHLTFESAKHQLLASHSQYLADEMEDHINPDYSLEENQIQIQELYRDAYSHNVISLHVLIVEREDKIIENMANAHINAAIIGGGHGDMMILHPEKLQQKSIEIGTYRSEKFYGQMNVISRKDEVDPSEDLNRRFLERRYTAVMQGRVNPTRTPQYIGYYLEDRRPPEAGVFEVYQSKGNGFSGIIEDGLGDANIAPGRITNEDVVFAKIYIPKRSSSLVGDQRPIIYRGTRQGDQYVGNYQLGQYTNTFVMKPFSQDVQLFTPGNWR